MKISEILHDAWLYHLSENKIPSYNQSQFSCIAIVWGDDREDDTQDEIIFKGLQNMGLPHNFYESCFDDIKDFVERQNARATWLMWAELMAIEQDI